MSRWNDRAGWALRLAVGLVLFWIAFRDVDPKAVAEAFAAAHPMWLATAVAAIFVTAAVITIRWAVLLGVALEAGSLKILFAAVIASHVANIVMPFRLGDAVRITAISRTLRLPAPEVLGSVAVERVLEVLIVALTAALLAATGVLPRLAHAGMMGLAVAAAVGLLILALLLSFGGTLRRLTASAMIAAVPEGIARWSETQIAHTLRGLQRASRPGVPIRALSLSCAVMAGAIVSAWLVMHAMLPDVPFVSAAVVVIVLQVGSVAVPVPGAIGIAQVLTVQTLYAWGVPEAGALAYALMLYLVSRVPKLLVLPLALPALASKPAHTA